MGPKTDSAKLSAAIKLTALNTPVTAELDLYDISGACQRVAMTCTPCSVEGNPVACKICIQRTANHSVEPRQTMDAGEPSAALSALPNDPAPTLPSPYARKQMCAEKNPPLNIRRCGISSGGESSARRNKTVFLSSVQPASRFFLNPARPSSPLPAPPPLPHFVSPTRPSLAQAPPALKRVPAPAASSIVAVGSDAP